MLRFDGIVFGPIHSRRLGTSLGINLLPEHGKLCNFDCIYCECGWNRDGRSSESFPSADEVSSALEERLRRIKDEGGHLDSITFSGHGEPTLHPEFARIIDRTVALRDSYFPDVQISVLSNATTLDREEVVGALKKTDNPILKLDAPNDAFARAVNRPQLNYDVAAVVRKLGRFGGNFILQTMMLGAPDADFSKDAVALQQWKEIVRQLRPRCVMVYTLDRPSPQEGLVKFTHEQMQEMLQDLMSEGLNINIY